MRIVLVKVSKKGGFREVLEAGRIIRHDVEVSWAVVGKVAVAMLPLLSTGKVAEVSRGTITGHRAFVDTGDGWLVVGEVDNSGIPRIVCGGHQVHLGEEACLLEIAVGDDPFLVVKGDKAALDIWGESLVPDVGSSGSVKVHATHARFGRVRGAQETGVLRDDLS